MKKYADKAKGRKTTHQESSGVSREDAAKYRRAINTASVNRACDEFWLRRGIPDPSGGPWNNKWRYSE